MPTKFSTKIIIWNAVNKVSLNVLVMKLSLIYKNMVQIMITL
jgi:hypothetical protein